MGLNRVCVVFPTFSTYPVASLVKCTTSTPLPRVPRYIFTIKIIPVKVLKSNFNPITYLIYPMFRYPIIKKIYIWHKFLLEIYNLKSTL